MHSALGYGRLGGRSSSMPLILFCHVPKCSGTTVRHYAQASYPLNEFFWLNREQEEIEPFFARVAMQPPSVLANSFVGGHFTLNDVLKYFMPLILTENIEIIFSTSLRDPFERFCSHYEFHLRNPSSYAQSLDLLCAPPASSCQVGIYNSNFGMACRKIYSYYLLPSDLPNSILYTEYFEVGQVKIHICYVANNSPDFLFLSLIHKSRKVCNGSISSSNTLPRLHAMLDASLKQGLKLNTYEASSSYGERYSTELKCRHEWFADDYQLISGLHTKMSI